MYTLTVAETETGAWAVLDNTGRQVWASPFFPLACRQAAQELAEQAAYVATVPVAVKRANAARARAWAQIDRRASR